MKPSSSDQGFFQQAPVLVNQFRDDVAFQRAFKRMFLSNACKLRVILPKLPKLDNILSSRHPLQYSSPNKSLLEPAVKSSSSAKTSFPIKYSTGSPIQRRTNRISREVDETPSVSGRESSSSARDGGSFKNLASRKGRLPLPHFFFLSAACIGPDVD